MTTMKGADVKAKINQIMRMEIKEVREFACELSISNIDDKARKYLNKAIDLRYAQLSDIISNDIIHSEVKLDELG